MQYTQEYQKTKKLKENLLVVAQEKMIALVKIQDNWKVFRGFFFDGVMTNEMLVVQLYKNYLKT